MTFAEFIKRPDLDSWKAIKKPMADGRTLLVGFERKSKRSRKYRIKELFEPPIVVEELLASRVAEINKINATKSQPVPTPTSPA